MSKVELQATRGALAKLADERQALAGVAKKLAEAAARAADQLDSEDLGEGGAAGWIQTWKNIHKELHAALAAYNKMENGK